jgi:acetyl-CoA carboxylase biotin carboxyl carrier protein
MTQKLDFLSNEDVQQINSLVDALDRSGFDYLQVDIGSIKVTVGKGSLPGSGGVLAPAIQPVTPSPAPAVLAPAAVAVAPSAAPPAEVATPAGQPGWVPITATTMGRFYSRPDPNSPPYVQVGAPVSVEDTVCLIEVMKLFNAIPAGVTGTIVQVCVEDAAIVEYGQTLFYVKP